MCALRDEYAAASQVLLSLRFIPLGEPGIPQRWAFKEPARLSGHQVPSHDELPR
jgi:hypothetical protein